MRLREQTLLGRSAGGRESSSEPKKCLPVMCYPLLSQPGMRSFFQQEKLFGLLFYCLSSLRDTWLAQSISLNPSLCQQIMVIQVMTWRNPAKLDVSQLCSWCSQAPAESAWARLGLNGSSLPCVQSCGQHLITELNCSDSAAHSALSW